MIPAADNREPEPRISFSTAATRELPRAAIAAIGVILVVEVFPALAPIVVWPLLCGLPAWFLVARVTPAISAPGRLGVAIIAGIEISAHLVYVLAHIPGIGLSTATVAVAAAILAEATWLLATLPLPRLAPPPLLSLAGMGRSLQRHTSAYALAALGSLVVGGILQASAWHTGPTGYISGGWNWSDFLVHVGIAQSIRYGNFPPQVPYFAGVPLSYHWFGDFHVALLSMSANVDVIPVLIVSNALLAGSLALVMHELARVLTGSQRAAALGVLLTLFAGGLGYIHFFMDLASHRGSVTQLLSTTPYDDNFFDSWPYFRIASVFGTALLDQRATAYGLAAFASAVLVLHVSWGRSRGGTLLAGVIAALMAPFQFFGLPTIYMVLAIQLLARRFWRDPDWRWQLTLLLLPAVYAATFVVGPALLQYGHGNAHLTLGWQDAPRQDGLLAVIFFYLTNLGLPFMLALVALFVRRTPQRLLLGGWTLAVFAVPNLFVVSAITLDANKFFQFMWPAVAVLAAWLMHRWRTWIVAIVLVLSCASAPLMAVWHLTDTRVVLSYDQAAAGRWIEQNTPERSVFVTDAFINSPVDLGGRLRLDSYGPDVLNLGYDPAPRDADVHAVYCDGPQQAAAIMRHDGAQYVLSSGGLLDCGAGRQPTDFTSSNLFQVVFTSGAVTIWRLL